MTKRINVGFNGSASSSEAVLWAAAEASSLGARLRVISCYRIPVMSTAGFGLTTSEGYTSILEETQGRLENLRRQIGRRYPTLDVTTLATSDPAAAVLVDDVLPDDLVVVGTTNRRGAAEFWLGSTARHVVRHSPCPVAVVPGPGSWGDTDRIVVGIDGSLTSKRALQWAGDEADRIGAELVVVHAWMYPYVRADFKQSHAHDLTRVDAACLLDREVESARERFGAEVTGQLIECSPSAALLGVVRHGDLLVMGSNGHGAIHATLHGSTVSSVLDHCSVPTVVVRSTP
jgi:nucleotide-binding universal stress UspA family protein